MTKKNKPLHIKLIANPGAGKSEEAARNLKDATSYLEQHGLIVDVALARPKEESTKIARRAVKRGYKLIAVMGGDGTVEAVMRGIVGGKARLGILPSGGQNNIARSLGIPEDLEAACELVSSGEAIPFDAGQIEVKKGKKFIFFEMATVGMAAAVYPAANKISDGKWSKIMDAALILIHQETRPKVLLTMNDESKLEVETMLVLVSNTPSFGQNFRVAPEASLQDGLLDISVFPDLNKGELLGYFAAVMDGGHSGNGKVQQYQARKVKIKSSPKLDVMADGVALGRGRAKIKARPGAFLVIAPRKGPEHKEAQDEQARTEKQAAAIIHGQKEQTEADVIPLG